MRPLIPGTPEHFFDQLATFFKEQAQGEVRCMVIAQTSVGQFWVHSTHPDLIWQFGMVRGADTVLSIEYQKRTQVMQSEIEKKDAEQDISIPAVKGKAN